MRGSFGELVFPGTPRLQPRMYPRRTTEGAYSLGTAQECRLDRKSREAGVGPGDDNLTVTRNQRIPVVVVYATALALEIVKSIFYDEMYGRDATLVRTLRKGYPYMVRNTYQRRMRPTSTCTNPEAA